MIMIFLALFGAVLGWQRAKRLDGVRADRIQWAIAHALAFGLLGFVITLIVSRLI